MNDTKRWDSACFPGHWMMLVGLAFVAGSAEGQCLLTEQSKLFPADSASNDSFGVSVAIEGSIALMGVPLADPLGANSAGSAYVYRFVGVNWVEEQKLTAFTLDSFSQFGTAIALDGPSNFILVGEPRRDGAAGLNVGKAYTFQYDGTNWIQGQAFLASDGQAHDHFGSTVAINGTAMLVGAEAADSVLGLDRGAVYAFGFDGSIWSENQKLTSSDGGATDEFGSVLSLDGNVFLVGAPQADLPGLSNAGAGYLYRHNGKSWVFEQKITASDAGVGDLFSGSVSLRGDIALVGARDANTGAGSAYVFRHNGSTWVQEQKLTASDGVAADAFGSSVSIEGNVAIVGAEFSSPSGVFFAGAVYIFLHNGVTWVEVAKFTASDLDIIDEFGTSAALDSSRLIVGATMANTAIAVDAGAGYFFPAMSDCDASGVLDLCEISTGVLLDLNGDGVPDVCETAAPCLGDIVPAGGGNGSVNIDDLVALLSAFGPCPAPPASCDADISPTGNPAGNGIVNIDDLVGLLGAFGPCP